MGTFVKVAKAGEVAADAGMMVKVGEKEIALFHVAGKYYALDNNCTHVGGPLAEGFIEGDKVNCPWHGASFSLETGEVLSPPAGRGVGCYPVRQQGDDIEIEV